MTERHAKEPTGQPPGPATHLDRRTFVGAVSGTVMTSGLLAGYGTFIVIAGRFLYATDEAGVGWQFLTTVDQLRLGDALTYTAPSGAQVVVARQSAGDRAEDFVALSSVCPHLGCQVHWEPQNDRFFCPCHNGAFDSQGNPTEGPPASAGQQLTRFPLMVERGLLFIQVPLTSVTQSERRI